MNFHAFALAMALSMAGLHCAAQTSSKPFGEADLAIGERLLKEHRCAECHTQRVGGDGSAIYRPKGRIDTPAALLAQVERCSTQLKLSLFPDEIASIAAVLNRDHYRFEP